MEPHRPNLTNLNPVFCKKHMSISSRSKSLFFGPHIYFFGRQNWSFLTGLAKCQNWGANVRNEEQRGNWLLYMYAMINDHQNSNDAQYTSILTFAPRILHLVLNFNIGWSIIIAYMIPLQYPQSSFLSAPQFWHLLLNSDIGTPAKKNCRFWGGKTPQKTAKKIAASWYILKIHFAKKMVKNDQSSPQRWPT